MRIEVETNIGWDRLGWEGERMNNEKLDSAQNKNLYHLSNMTNISFYEYTFSFPFILPPPLPFSNTLTNLWLNKLVNSAVGFGLDCGL